MIRKTWMGLVALCVVALPLGAFADTVVVVGSDTPKPITDTSTTTSTGSTATGGTIEDVDVEINLTHTFDGDLDISIISPAGTEVELSTDNGGSGDDFLGTVFDDSAGTSITSGTAPFTGTFSPEGSLSDINDEDAAGTWTLKIVDDAGGDIGTLLSWSVTLTTASCCDCDEDGYDSLECDGLDCDDSDSDINPDGQEVCDEEDADEDCDGLTEDDDPSATGFLTYYEDLDDDGYGNPDVTIDQCQQPVGYAPEPAVCGDGVVNTNGVDIEECDDAEDNSDTEPDACRTTCVLPACGDGVTDEGAGEDCDDGLSNSDTEADACRTDCAAAGCGDGVVDMGEGCDDGNYDDTDACLDTCVSSTCGDGWVQEGEECDQGLNNSDVSSNACRTTCVSAYCGDGVRDDGERCDDGDANSDSAADACRSNCQIGTCGDGVVDSGEACDDGMDNGDGRLCLSDCTENPSSGSCKNSVTSTSRSPMWMVVVGVGALLLRRRRRA